MIRAGTTPARGREGRSRRSAELESALDGLPTPRETAPVYGCPLF